MSENTITLTDEHGNVFPTAAALVYYIRAEVNGLPKWEAYATEYGVTRETVKDHAVALAVLAYPNEEPVQKQNGKRTKFGNAVQAAGNGLRRALGKDEDNSDKPRVLRVSLSGEGGGTTIVPEDHPMYATLIEMIGAGTDEQ